MNIVCKNMLICLHINSNTTEGVETGAEHQKWEIQLRRVNRQISESMRCYCLYICSTYIIKTYVICMKYIY